MRSGAPIRTSRWLFKVSVDALTRRFGGSGPLITLKRDRVYASAIAAGLPAISGLRVHAQAGSLMSYGPDHTDLFRRAGATSTNSARDEGGDIPVQQPTKFELIINLKTAKALALKCRRCCWPAPTR